MSANWAKRNLFCFAVGEQLPLCCRVSFFLRLLLGISPPLFNTVMTLGAEKQWIYSAVQTALWTRPKSKLNPPPPPHFAFEECFQMHKAAHRCHLVVEIWCCHLMAYNFLDQCSSNYWIVTHQPEEHRWAPGGPENPTEISSGLPEASNHMLKFIT